MYSRSVALISKDPSTQLQILFSENRFTHPILIFDVNFSSLHDKAFCCEVMTFFHCNMQGSPLIKTENFEKSNCNDMNLKRVALCSVKTKSYSDRPDSLRTRLQSSSNPTTVNYDYKMSNSILSGNKSNSVFWYVAMITNIYPISILNVGISFFVNKVLYYFDTGTFSC